MAVVAASSFSYLPVSLYERPRHNIYPLDTLPDFEELFRSVILDPKKVVIVAEGE